MHQPTNESFVACFWVYLRNQTPTCQYVDRIQTLDFAKYLKINANQLSQCFHTQKRAVKSNNDALGRSPKNGTISFLSRRRSNPLAYGLHSSVGSNWKDVFNHRTMVMLMLVWFDLHA